MRGFNLVLGVVMALGACSAWAVNKCTLPGGRVVFQDAPCDTAAQKSETVKTWDSNLTDRSRNGSWRFLRDIDDMTGKRSCFAISPDVNSGVPVRGYEFVWVRLVVSVVGESEFVGVRTHDDKTSFHNDISGMGLKLSNTEFIPLDIKAGSHLVSSRQGKLILDALPAARDVRLRLRFWPYDTLHDAAPISMTGFQQAYASAKRCAGQSEAPAAQ